MFPISSLDKIKKPEDKPRNTRISRNFRRAVNYVTLRGEELPAEERTDIYLLRFMPMAIRNVELTKYAQLSVTDEKTFDDIFLECKPQLELRIHTRKRKIAKKGSEGYG